MCVVRYRWNVAEAYLKSIDLDDLSVKSPVPVRILIRWLNAASNVYNIGVALSTRSEDVINPLAQRIFETIDSDKDGALSADEIVCHFLTEYGAKHAHKFLTVIDVNADGIVTNEEWHRAWRNGDFDVEVRNDLDDEGRPISVTAAGSELRIMSKHLSAG